MWLEAIRHLFSAQGDYRLHSPFVYHFYQEVLRGSPEPQAMKTRQLRSRMLKDQRLIRFEDLGAGSRRSGEREVKSSLGRLAARAGRRQEEGEFLLRLTRFCKPNRMLELGTHLGFSAMYQHLGAPQANFITVEGIPELAGIARENFDQLGMNIELRVGSFDRVLKEELLPSSLDWDYIFLDGNHSYEATMRYFTQLLPRLSRGGLMLFDDIYWSEGMQRAWQEIISHPEVSVSIDLFRFGLCFIRRPQAKEHFRLRAWRLFF